MINPNWQNPYSISEKTAGIYTFWPKPIESEREEIEKDFELEIIVENDNFDSLRHYFTLKLKSESLFSDYFNINNCFEIEDLYLIPA